MKKRYACHFDLLHCPHGWLTQDELDQHLAEHPDHASRIYDSKLELAKQFGVDNAEEFEKIERSLVESFGGNVPPAPSEFAQPDSYQ